MWRSIQSYSRRNWTCTEVFISWSWELSIWMEACIQCGYDMCYGLVRVIIKILNKTMVVVSCTVNRWFCDPENRAGSFSVSLGHFSLGHFFFLASWCVYLPPQFLVCVSVSVSVFVHCWYSVMNSSNSVLQVVAERRCSSYWSRK